MTDREARYVRQVERRSKELEEELVKVRDKANEEKDNKMNGREGMGDDAGYLQQAWNRIRELEKGVGNCKTN